MFLNQHKIRDIRVQNTWTQQQLADLCNVSIRTIQRVERDGIASMETTMALAAAFNTPKKSLMVTIQPEKFKFINNIFYWSFIGSICYEACNGPHLILKVLSY